MAPALGLLAAFTTAILAFATGKPLLHLLGVGLELRLGLALGLGTLDPYPNPNPDSNPTGKPLLALLGVSDPAVRGIAYP